ncbi:MAG: YbjN domain-containing protein [Selenomonadaceae bacterium]|nr:YbjN domain-containing protein [Selenomonadaceae bacterium]
MENYYDEERNTLAEIKTAVENYFRREDLQYSPFDERNIASVPWNIDLKLLNTVTVYFRAYDDKLVIHFILPVRAAEEVREKVGEFLLRANYGLKVGGFDFDFNDGEISYRIAYYLGEEEFAVPTYEQLDFAMSVGLTMVQKYGDALMKVMYGFIQPEAAIIEAEAED